MLPEMATNVWFDKPRYDEAETKYYLYLQKKNYGIDIQARPVPTALSSHDSQICKSGSPTSLASQIAEARQQIKESLQSGDTMTGATTQQVEDLKKTVNYLVEALKKVELRMSELESKCSCGAASKGAAPKSAPAPAAKPADDDDIDLFGSDEDEEANKVREERLKQYAEKKSKKPGPIAKSSIVLDVKPWDDETDLGVMEKHVRSVQMDGLIWGTSKLVPLAFGIKKLQIVCVVEDDKVSIDELTETIQEFEDFVQSVDIAAFNKI